MDRLRAMHRRPAIRGFRAFRIPRALLLLSGLAMGTIGSCSLPSIKPPNL